jgi:formamidopyrimidine-DNA glycosylase
MPELPEVESLRRSLEPYILGQLIRTVKVKLPKLVTSSGTKRENSLAKAKEFESQVTGQTILSLERRAKNLIFKLDDQSIILAHLKMTGQFVYKSKSSSGLVMGGHPIQDSETKLPNKHTYIIFELEKGVLYFNDVRQFGYVLWYPSYQVATDIGHLQNLGVEPLSEDFLEEYFVDSLYKKKGVLKKILLDQKIVVGLGNIYVDECCFLAGIKPHSQTDKLTKNRLKKLYQSIKQVLPKAVSLGGSSVSNYLLADGSRGNYAREHFVYLRGGKPCKLCGTTLSSLSVGGRTTVYCPHCQK